MSTATEGLHGAVPSRPPGARTSGLRARRSRPRLRRQPCLSGREFHALGILQARTSAAVRPLHLSDLAAGTGLSHSATSRLVARLTGPRSDHDAWRVARSPQCRPAAHPGRAGSGAPWHAAARPSRSRCRMRAHGHPGVSSGTVGMGGDESAARQRVTDARRRTRRARSTSSSAATTAHTASVTTGPVACAPLK